MADENKENTQTIENDSQSDSVEALQSKLQEAIRSRDNAKAKFTDYENIKTKLAQYEQEAATRAAKETASKEENDRKEMAYKGRFDELEKTYQSKMASRDSESKKREEELHRSYRQPIIRSLFKAELAKVKNVHPEAVDDIVKLYEDRLDLDDDKNPYIVEEKADDSGKKQRVKRTDKDMKPISLSDFANEVVLSKSHFQLGVLPKGTGTRAGAAKSSSTVWDIEVAKKDSAYNMKWKAEDPDGHRASWNAYNRELLDGRK